MPKRLLMMLASWGGEHVRTAAYVERSQLRSLPQLLQAIDDDLVLRLGRVITLDLPDGLAEHLPTFSGASDVMELLASLPTPEEILALRPSPALQTRINELLDKNRTVGLSPTEEDEWRRYQYVEHLVRLAKAAAKIQ